METKTEVKLHEEMKKMEYEPLDPVELKLVHWSWGLGVALLIVLFVISKFVMTVH